MSGSATQLKYLVRRLRVHAPSVRIVVGLWPASSDELVDRERLEAIGGDLYVTSLREAVDACVGASA